jgi:hypothetical protein
MKPIAKEIIGELVDELYAQRVMSNLTRPLYVERLLARLLNGRWQCVGSDWSGWDLENPDTKLRIEVKQSAARQTWTDGPTRVSKATKPIFDIEERTGYFADGGASWVNNPGRPADLYIFAWHPLYEPKGDVDHTDPEQWEFYLVRERDLPTGQKTIALSSLEKLRHVRARHDDIGGKVESLVPDLQPLKATRASDT